MNCRPWAGLPRRPPPFLRALLRPPPRRARLPRGLRRLGARRVRGPRGAGRRRRGRGSGRGACTTELPAAQLRRHPGREIRASSRSTNIYSIYERCWSAESAAGAAGTNWRTSMPSKVRAGPPWGRRERRSRERVCVRVYTMPGHGTRAAVSLSGHCGASPRRHTRRAEGSREGRRALPDGSRR